MFNRKKFIEKISQLIGDSINLDNANYMEISMCLAEITASLSKGLPQEMFYRHFVHLIQSYEKFEREERENGNV
jgi:hypothetical protein